MYISGVFFRPDMMKNNKKIQKSVDIKVTLYFTLKMTEDQIKLKVRVKK